MTVQKIWTGEVFPFINEPAIQVTLNDSILNYDLLIVCGYTYYDYYNHFIQGEIFVRTTPKNQTIVNSEGTDYGLALSIDSNTEMTFKMYTQNYNTRYTDVYGIKF